MPHPSCTQGLLLVSAERISCRTRRSSWPFCHAAPTNQRGCAWAQAGQRQQTVPRLFRADYDVLLWVQEWGNQGQTAALEHLDVQRH